MQVRELLWHYYVLWPLSLTREAERPPNLVRKTGYGGVRLPGVALGIFTLPGAPRDLADMANYVADLVPVTSSFQGPLSWSDRLTV